MAVEGNGRPWEYWKSRNKIFVEKNFANTVKT
jgi:hypothetical protein